MTWHLKHGIVAFILLAYGKGFGNDAQNTTLQRTVAITDISHMLAIAQEWKQPLDNDTNQRTGIDRYCV
jgi:hypothetical protein